MAFSLENISQLYKLEKLIKNKKILLVGDHLPNFHKIPRKLIKKYNLKKDLNNYSRTDQRVFLKQLLNCLGFTRIVTIDNFENKHLNYKIDLSIENSSNTINEKFGIVLDNGTSIYCNNIITALNNVQNLVDEGGYLLTSLDPFSFNRFPFLPAPETLVDYMLTKKLNCTQLDLKFHSLLGEVSYKPYKLNYLEKNFAIYRCLDFFEFLNLIKYIFFDYLFSTKIKDGININDYEKNKINNFTNLKNMHDDYIHKNLNIKNLLKKKGLFMFAKKILSIKKTIMNAILRSGKVYLDFEFKKNTNITDNKCISSTLYYEVQWRIK
jgi:hypothetical protein